MGRLLRSLPPSLAGTRQTDARTAWRSGKPFKIDAPRGAVASPGPSKPAIIR